MSQTILSALCAFLLLSHPHWSSGKNWLPEVNTSDSLSSDEDYLLLIDRIPLGVTYEEVKQVLSTVGELRPEGRSELSSKRGLLEALLQINILDKQADLEFNFEYGKLYSYYYSIRNLDSAEAVRLNSQLVRFYESHFGEYHQSIEYDPTSYRAEGSFWDLDDFSLGVMKNVDRTSCVLSWGFQKKRR